MTERRFLQSLSQKQVNILARIARKKGISIQELIRAVIIGDYLEKRKREQERAVTVGPGH